MGLSYSEASEFLGLQKSWNANSFPWTLKDRNGIPPTLECHVTLKDEHGVVIEDALVVLRHKSSAIPGVPDCLNAILLYQKQRIISLDENGPRSHTNRVGVGMPYFGQTLEHPHIHIPVAESMDGYAEPIDNRDIQNMWHIFLEAAGIIGAPALQLPPSEQLELAL